MTESTSNIEHVLIQDQMKEAYLDYAMSVIIGRALPDVRDGLKPVHRRILWAMHERSWRHNRPYVKSAKIVGEVIGNFHPHGDSAVYDTMVRMVQDFSLNLPLIDGQGNYGSVDGDAAAAYRYTEARLTRTAELLLKDIDKETVNYNDNFDETRKEPQVLPAAFPNLLVNGSSGIAVGMATNIPPHNLLEVISGIEALLDNPAITIDELAKLIPAPDFPTGGIIIAGDGLKKAYRTGHGTIRIRGKLDVTESTRKKEAIIVTELPYQVNKLNLINKIADLVNNKVIEGISDIRDESNRFGIRIVMELKKNYNAQTIINLLYKQTQLEISYGINLLAIHKNRPKQLNLKEILEAYIEHRTEVITRRTEFELKKARDRAHILEGLKIALENIDEVIRIIRASRNAKIAKEALMSTFELSDVQAQAILDMRLHRLTSLEVQKVIDELRRLNICITELSDILSKGERITLIVREELIDVKYDRTSKTPFEKLMARLQKEDGVEEEAEETPEGEEGEKAAEEDETDTSKLEEKAAKRHARQSQITYGKQTSSDFDALDLIADKPIVIILSSNSYLKAVELSKFRKQKRGGRGVQSSSSSTEDDSVKLVQIGTTHQNLLFFSNHGKAYMMACHELPLTNRDSRGRSIKNFLPLAEDEQVSAITVFDDFKTEQFLCMITRDGILKKCRLDEFKNVRKRGIMAIKLNDNDALIDVKLADPGSDVVVASQAGNALRTNLAKMRAMGRSAAGIIGMRIESGDAIIGLAIVKDSSSLLVITSNGYGKRINYDQFAAKGRGGKGMAYLKVSDKSGHCIGFASVMEADDVIITTQSGMVIRTQVANVPEMGRTATGVKVVNLKDDDTAFEIGVIPD